jgi:hypothetical protein
VSRIRAAATRPALERLDYRRQCQAGTRDNARPGGSIVITGRLNAILGDAAFPNGVCGKAVAGAGIEPATYGL